MEGSYKIYISAPAHAASGGPADLQMLCRHLREDFSLKAFMFYYGVKNHNPVPESYESYQNPYVMEIEDDSRNVLIVPEVASGISALKEYKRIRKIVWWLSVDNFYNTVFEKQKNFINFFYQRYPLSESPLLKDVCVHLCQSYYALNHLKSKGLSNVRYLSDYINCDDSCADYKQERKRRIAYNPAKGMDFMKKIMEIMPEEEFFPLKNMTNAQLISSLRESMVYADFGNFPGKDKIPREAALSGCCVIKGKNGAGGVFEDFPFLDEFSFERKEENLPLIKKAILECLNDFERNSIKYEDYRSVLKSEREVFIRNLGDVVENVINPCVAA